MPSEENAALFRVVKKLPSLIEMRLLSALVPYRMDEISLLEALMLGHIARKYECSLRCHLLFAKLKVLQVIKHTRGKMARLYM